MELNRDELWDLRQSITLGSLNYSDFENELGLDPHVVAEFFDGYMDFLEEKMLEDGYSDADFFYVLNEYDTPENLEEWYNCSDVDPLAIEKAPLDPSTDEDTGDRIRPDIIVESKKLKEDNTDLTPETELEYAAKETDECPVTPVYPAVPEELENTLNEAYHDLSDKEIAKTIIDEISETLDAHEEVLNDTIKEAGSDGLFAVGTQQLIDSLREILSDLRVMTEAVQDLNSSKKRITEATGTEDVDRLYNIIDTLGYEEVLDNLIKWLPNEDVAQFADDIARDYDLDYDEDEEEEEDEDVFDDTELDDDSEYWDEVKASADYFREK